MTYHAYRAPLTLEETARQLARLNGVFPKFSDTDYEKLAEGYFAALRDLDAENVAGAVDLAMKEEPRFPVPAKLREHAQRWRQHNRVTLATPTAASPEGAPRLCQHCDARPHLALLRGHHLQSGEEFTFQRYIAPCDTQRPHPNGYIPFPPNFVEWSA